MKHCDKRVWIGLAHFAPLREGILNGATGAYANVLAAGESRGVFIENVKKELQTMGFILLEIQDVEPFARRLKRYHVSRECRRAAKAVLDGKGVMFTTFHTYADDSGEAIH